MSKTLLTSEIAGAQKKLESVISAALSSHGKESRGILPDGCSWQCWVEIGPDGKPAVKCGIKCD